MDIERMIEEGRRRIAEREEIEKGRAEARMKETYGKWERFLAPLLAQLPEVVQPWADKPDPWCDVIIPWNTHYFEIWLRPEESLPIVASFARQSRGEELKFANWYVSGCRYESIEEAVAMAIGSWTPPLPAPEPEPEPEKEPEQDYLDEAGLWLLKSIYLSDDGYPAISRCKREFAQVAALISLAAEARRIANLLEERLS